MERTYKSGRGLHLEKSPIHNQEYADCVGHPGVRRSALVGVAKGGETVPVLCVERDASAPHDERTITQDLLEIAQNHAHTREIATVLFHASFPVDVRHNAKIFREKLAVWAEEQLT